jgi:hypothetical protein
MDFPLNAPRFFVQGDSISFDVAMSGYSPVDWDLKFVVLADTPVAFDALEVGETFRVELTPAQSLTIPAGRVGFCYVFINTATNKRDTYGPWPVVVQPNPLLPRVPSWAQVQLTSVNAAIAKLLTGANKQVSVDGQTYTKRDLKELMDMRHHLEFLVTNELRVLGLIAPTSGNRKIVTRFVP